MKASLTETKVERRWLAAERLVWVAGVVVGWVGLWAEEIRSV